MKCLYGGIALFVSVMTVHAQTESDSLYESETGEVLLNAVSTERTPIAFAHEPTDEVPAWHDMFTRLPGDWGRFAENTFQTKKIPAIVGIGGLTAALMLADDQTWRATNDFSNISNTSRTITHSFAELGDGKTILGIAGGFAIVGWAGDDSRALRTASQLVQSYISCGITVQVFKHLSGRERPERQSQPRGKWDFLPNQKLYHRAMPRFDAFPSGHTAAAMGMVTVLIENYPEAKWLRPVGYTAVGLVGFGLVSRGWHWYSDLPLAIALGYEFGMLAAHPERADAPTSQVSFLPALGEDGVGVMVNVSF